MKLREFIGLVSDPSDVVSVYDTTEGDLYHTLYEGSVNDLPSNLLERDVCSIYGSFVLEEPGICIGLHGYDGFEE